MVVFSYWWINLKAVKKFPNSEAVSKEYMEKKFWKLKLLILILTEFRHVTGMMGHEIFGNDWYADYTDFLPKIRLRYEESN